LYILWLLLLKIKQKNKGDVRMSMRILYKNTKTVSGRNKAMSGLKKAGLNPAYTNGFRKGTTQVYAQANKKTLKGFKVKRQKMSYI